MATTALLPRHVSEGKSILTSIKDSIEYGKNPNKTRDGKLISTYACDPRTAALEFVLAKKQYTSITGREQSRERDILLYQIRQSFKPGDITPEEANRLAYELAIRFTKGNHAFIVTTHDDKAHIHSHIYFNSTALDCERKFNNFLGSTWAVRRLSDYICVENGLSVIKEPKQSKGNYGTWLGNNKRVTHRDKIKQAIDTILVNKPTDFEDFLHQMETAGYEIQRKKNITFKSFEQKKPIRCNSLKGDYTEDAIRERIEGTRVVEPVIIVSETVYTEPFKINLLIDIENSIKAKGSPGYEQWAKIFNLKQAAQTLIYLQENNLDEYEKLEKKVNETKDLHYELLEKMKPIEKRLSEIKDLQKHIGNYGKTKDIYTEYRKAGYSKKFLSAHEGEIILHQAAKKAFETLGLKKLPTIKMLQTEYATLKSEKGKLYNAYRQTKEDMKNLSTVKANTDRLLAYSKGAKTTEREQDRK